jgi:hypothetical protein
VLSYKIERSFLTTLFPLVKSSLGGIGFFINKVLIAAIAGKGSHNTIPTDNGFSL